MRLVLLLSLVAVLVSGVLCQYSCPLIDYSQSIEPVPSSLFPDSAAYQLSFVSHSPQMPLAFLDVHYAINDADTNNVRLLSSSPAASAAADSGRFPPFLLADTDQLDYWFTYEVKALGLACDTHHFQVTGREVKEHAMAARQADAKAQGMDSGKESDKDAENQRDSADQHTAAVDDQAKPDNVSVTADSRTLPTLHETNPTLVIPPLGPTLTDVATPAAEPMDRFAPTVSRTAEPLDLNAGVCPLIPFTHQLTRASSPSPSPSQSPSVPALYRLAFHNQSPSQPLAFLDVHFAVNDGPAANLRLFSDPSADHSGDRSGDGGRAALASNEARALAGIAMVGGDVLQYSFTYGVKEGAGASGGEGKVRACNTEVYKVKIDESIK